MILSSKGLKPRIYCKDGFNMSVQDHEHAYCNPGYTSEVGFPSEEEPLLKGYAEDSDNPTETIYAHVPNKLIQEIINKHGGIK